MATPDPRVADRRRPYRPAHRSARRRASGWLRVGLADVQLALAVFAGLTAVEMRLLGRPLWMLLFAAAAGSAVVSRVGLHAVAVVALAYNLLSGGPSNHVALLFWTSAAAGLVSGRDFRSVLRVLVAVVYGFAVANKLVGGVDLVTAHLVTRGGLPEQLAGMAAVGAVVVQAFLAWAVIRGHWTALPIAVGLHAGIVVVMSRTLLEWVAMVAFNGLMVWVVCLLREPPLQETQLRTVWCWPS